MDSSLVDRIDAFCVILSTIGELLYLSVSVCTYIYLVLNIRNFIFILVHLISLLDRAFAFD